LLIIEISKALEFVPVVLLTHDNSLLVAFAVERFGRPQAF
jgi:hypothetical protein